MVHVLSIFLMVLTFFLAGIKILELIGLIFDRIVSSTVWYKTTMYAFLAAILALYLVIMLTGAIDVLFFNK